MKKRYAAVYSALLILFAACVYAGLFLRPAGVIYSGVPERHIINMIRLPRVLAAIMLGGALSLSGMLMQSFFANPIAGPFVLGISSGAKLAVAAVTIFIINARGLLGAAVSVTAAFVGSVAVLLFVLLMSRRTENRSSLIICGVMAGYVCSALTELMITFADESGIVNLHSWSQGSFAGINMFSVRTAAPAVLIASAGTFLLSKPLGAYELGEDHARSVGLDIKRFRVILLLLSGFLSACVTAFAGPVSFVGIAVPHIAKRALGTSKPAVVMPAVFLGGGIFCLFCDIIARLAFAPTELSLNTVTAVIGAPVVIWIMTEKKRR
ncbi:MAG: iron ABC transporter permease [Oscillospiraceae bacterium]|nr:iron ABC transporter permease [Oscillospiraceae bacterium]